MQVGHKEEVSLPDNGVITVAQFDTGAECSLIFADSIEMLHDGKHVRFGFKSNTGTSFTLKRPIVTTTLVRAPGHAPKPCAIVSLSINIHGRHHVEKFALVEAEDDAAILLGLPIIDALNLAISADILTGKNAAKARSDNFDGG